MRLLRPLAVLLTVTALAATGGVLAPVVATAPAPSAAGSAQVDAAPRARPAVVVEQRVIGRSVQGRPIRAWHLGEPGRDDVPTVVLISTMHGNEPATRGILQALRDGRPIRGVDLWVVPEYNPDGLARGSRRNARGVDLNRNYPYRWADLDGNYESGRRPKSEPETRAMIRFLREVRPDRLLSFHQPLYGVDTDTKNRPFARRVARILDLPRKRFDCGGVCHGTMTTWFNHHFKGAALTVEYGVRPGRHRMRKTAPGQVLSLFGARRVRASRG